MAMVIARLISTFLLLLLLHSAFPPIAEAAHGKGKHRAAQKQQKKPQVKPLPAPRPAVERKSTKRKAAGNGAERKTTRIKTSRSKSLRTKTKHGRVAISPERKKLEIYAMEIQKRLNPKVQGALDRINLNSRRVLAMKYYLQRDSGEIERKWAWTAEESKEYRKGPEYQEALTVVENVRKLFTLASPGYQIYVDPEIRSLSSQIQKWNATASVGVGAEDLFAATLRFFADTLARLDSVPTDSSISKFTEFLRAFEPSLMPTVAVPGLSQHGQLRAFDFKIKQGKRLIAGTSAATIARLWDTPGWTVLLQEVACMASDKLHGPLQEPYEPWHYTYTP